MKAPYVVLGVSENASQGEIKTAYRRLAKINHPDNGGDRYAFDEIHRAYSELAKGEKFNKEIVKEEKYFGYRLRDQIKYCFTKSPVSSYYSARVNGQARKVNKGMFNSSRSNLGNPIFIILFYFISSIVAYKLLVTRSSDSLYITSLNMIIGVLSALIFVTLFYIIESCKKFDIFIKFIYFLTYFAVLNYTPKNHVIIYVSLSSALFLFSTNKNTPSFPARVHYFLSKFLASIVTGNKTNI